MEGNSNMKIKNNERGQSLVELAISLVVLLYLLSGVVEFGIAFFQFIQLRDAAQEGALYGSIHPTESANIEARVRNASQEPIDLLDDTLVDVTITTTGTPPCAGESVQVEVEFDHQIFMPFIPALIGTSTIPLTGSVTDTILQPACPLP
jgi:Flp pilus assembly protein TadG